MLSPISMLSRGSLASQGERGNPTEEDRWAGEEKGPVLKEAGRSFLDRPLSWAKISQQQRKRGEKGG